MARRVGSNPWTLTVQREAIRITTALAEPDPAWRYTDMAGDEHAYQDGPNHYPSLMWIVDDTYWCTDCEDEHERGHWQCPLCGEHIVPGTWIDPMPKYIPGVVEVSLAYDDGREQRSYAIASAEAHEAAQYRPDAFIASLDATNVDEPAPGVRLTSRNVTAHFG